MQHPPRANAIVTAPKEHDIFCSGFT